MNGTPCPHCGTLLTLQRATARPVLRTNTPPDAPHYEIVRQLGGELNLAAVDIVGDRRVHQPRTDCSGCRDEFGHGIYAAGVSGGLVDDVEVSDCWGDGVVFDYKHPQKPEELWGVCRDVTLRSVRVRECRRNALYIGGGSGYLIDRCELRAFMGVDPRAAIDLEPEKLSMPVTGVRIKDTHIYGADHGFGIVADDHGIEISGLVIEGGSITAAPVGWAAWLKGLRGYNVMRNVKIYGPLVHLRNIHFAACEFIADPHNQQYSGHVASQHEGVSFDADCIFR